MVAASSSATKIRRLPLASRVQVHVPGGLRYFKSVLKFFLTSPPKKSFIDNSPDVKKNSSCWVVRSPKPGRRSRRLRQVPADSTNTMSDHTYELSPPAPPNPPPLWPPPPSDAEGEWSGIVLAGISFASSCCLVLLCGLLLIARRRLQIRAAATRTAASDHGELRKMERLLDAMPQQSYRRCSCASCEEGGCTCRGCCGGAPHGKGEACSICLSQFEAEPARLVRRTPCAHYFHAECIDRWLLTEDTCPLCKVAIGAWEGEATALAAVQAPPAGEAQLELEVRGEEREDSDGGRVGERESDSVWDGHG